MSFTTMNMSALRILVFDRGDAEMRVALQSGWTRSDLIWERWMEAALTSAADGHKKRAMLRLRLADLLARLWFPSGDPRRAAAGASVARLLYRSGKTRRAEAWQRHAILEFSGIDAFISDLRISPRARSSLFHMRMEALHRGTYHDNLRRRLGKIAGETREHLKALTSDAQPPYRLFSRWRGEKPGVHDDTRKSLGSCLLIPD